MADSASQQYEMSGERNEAPSPVQQAKPAGGLFTSKMQKLEYSVEGSLPWLWAGITFVAVMELIIALVCVGISEHSGAHGFTGPDLWYSDFASEKYLIFVGFWTVLALIYLYCSRPHHEKAWTQIKLFKLPYKLTRSLVCCLLTMIFWFSAAIAQAAWVEKKYYCHDPEACAYLVAWSHGLAIFLAVFAFVEVALWVIPASIIIDTTVDLIF